MKAINTSLARFTGTALVAICVGMLVWSFASFIIGALDLPTVYESHATGECVKVEGEGSCDDLPERYHHKWVR